MAETEGLHTEPPPAYTEATRDAPPTYEQLFGMSQMKEEVMQAKNDSPNHGIFAFKFCSILCSSVACMICLIFLAALPVTMIVIGSIYLHDCPGRRLIPIWLIVFGAISLIQTSINIVKRCFKRKRRDSDDEDGEGRDRDYGKNGGSCLESLFSVFLFVWIIIGSVWVFGYYPIYASVGECHAVPYLFSFITLVLIYSLSFLFFFCFSCCFVCIACVMGLSGNS